MNKGIKQNFYFILIMVVVVIALTFLFFTLLIFKPKIQGNRAFYEYTMDNVEANIEQRLSQIVSIAEYVVYNETVQYTLNNELDLRTFVISEMKNYMEICQYLDEDLLYMGIHDMDGSVFEFYEDIKCPIETKIFKKILVEYPGMDVNGEIVFLDDVKAEYFAFVMPVFDVKSEEFVFKKKIGNFILAYSVDAFRKDIYMSNRDAVDKIAVVDRQEVIRITTDTSLLGKKMEEGEYDDVRILKKERLKICSNYFERYSEGIIKEILTFGLIIAAEIALSLIIINFWFKRFVIGDINNILSVLRENQDGYAKKRVALTHKNELQDIGQNINYMLDSIDEYVHRVFVGQQRLYEMELLVNKMRFYMLKEQVGPHFLYNTLGCIRCLAEEKDAQDIAEISESLISLLRYNLKEQDKMPLYNEIAMCKRYIQIINVRYENNVEFSYEIQEEIQEAEVVKMMIQPILENAILHGMRSNDEKLYIRISAEQADGELKVVIADNGVGMDQRKLQELEASFQEEVSEFSHIGLYNVHRRICMAYGEKYGLSIDSVKGEGCTVYIRLPLLMEQDGAYS